MKKLIIICLLLIFCTVTACASQNDGTELSIKNGSEKTLVLKKSAIDTEFQNISEAGGESEKPEELFFVFGLTILLPENPNWIKNMEYTLIDENNMEIYYYDDIAGVDCKLSVVKNGTLDLPEYEYEKTLEETWQGESPAGDIIYVKLQRAVEDGKVLATWEYRDYKFAIQGDVNDITDTCPISKTALYIISNLV